MKNETFALKANPKVVRRISLLLLGKETGLGFFLIMPRMSTETLDIDSCSGMEES